MRAINNAKPVNVLARHIATWINERAEDGKPFSSFEALRTNPIGQKDVERWILNCNYTYYRLGDVLFDNDLFPSSDEDVELLFEFLDEKLKSIRDSNPLKLRSKQPNAIVDELAKDWPPFCERSRNDLKQSADALKALLQHFAPIDPGMSDAIRQFTLELADEARWYRAFERETSGEPVSKRCRELLPIWCIKEINPLYSLLIWQDEREIASISEELTRSFAENGYPSYNGGSRHDAYRGVVGMSQHMYLDEMSAADGRDARNLSISQIATALELGDFSLDRPEPVTGLPTWMPGKSLLIWNIAICSILGPREAIRPLGIKRTATTFEPTPSAAGATRLRGETLLRRQMRNGECELVDAIDLGNADPKGTIPLSPSANASRLWLVLGSSYDEQARIPDFLERAEANLACHFLPTTRLDERGNQVEGHGDSRYHAALILSAADTGWTLELVDLGAKNGTYAIRQSGNQPQFYVLPGRTSSDAGEWAKRLGAPVEHVHIANTVVLERGDIIQLCGSRFELL